MKRIYLMILFATLATIVSAQTDDKGYKEGAWVLKRCDRYKYVANCNDKLVGRW